MNTIEDRLRDAYQATAQAIRPDSIEHVHDQARQRARAASGTGFRARFRQSGSRGRLLVPLAAAAAVALIAVAASLVIPGGPEHGRGSAAGGSLPRFFLAEPDMVTGSNMGVFSATTGRLLALVTPPSRGSVIDVAAATGNDRSFVVAVRSASTCSATALYRLRLTASGHPGALTPLAAPKISGVITAMAASSDGRTIAYATEFCGKASASPGAIGVIHAATGQARQWTWRPNPGQIIASVNVTADGRLIEYAASPNKVTGPGSGQILPVRTVRLLPADAPPGSAVQRSHVVADMSRLPRTELFGSAAIAADGRTVYFCTERSASHPAPGVFVLRAYDVATAATSVLRIFNWRQDICMLGLSGDHLLVGYGSAAHPPRLARYDVLTGKSVPLPVPRQWGEVTTNIPW